MKFQNEDQKIFCSNINADLKVHDLLPLRGGSLTQVTVDKLRGGQILKKPPPRKGSRELSWWPSVDVVCLLYSPGT